MIPTGNVTGQGRVLYYHPEQMNVVLVSLPDGIEFKQPSLYKSNELRCVHHSLDKFKFVSLDSDSIETTPLSIVSNTVTALSDSTELNSSVDYVSTKFD